MEKEQIDAMMASLLAIYRNVQHLRRVQDELPPMQLAHLNVIDTAQSQLTAWVRQERQKLEAKRESDNG